MTARIITKYNFTSVKEGCLPSACCVARCSICACYSRLLSYSFLFESQALHKVNGRTKGKEYLLWSAHTSWQWSISQVQHQELAGRRKKYLHPVKQHQQEGTDDDCLEDLPVPAEGSQPWHEELPCHLDEARHHGDHEPVPGRTELYPWNTEYTDSQPPPAKTPSEHL